MACGWMNWRQLSQESVSSCLRMTSRYDPMFSSLFYSLHIRITRSRLHPTNVHQRVVVSTVEVVMVDVATTGSRCVPTSVHLYRCGHASWVSQGPVLSAPDACAPEGGSLDRGSRNGRHHNSGCHNSGRRNGGRHNSRHHDHGVKVHAHVHTFVQTWACLMGFTGPGPVCTRHMLVLPRLD